MTAQKQRNARLRRERKRGSRSAKRAERRRLIAHRFRWRLHHGWRATRAGMTAAAFAAACLAW